MVGVLQVLQRGPPLRQRRKRILILLLLMLMLELVDEGGRGGEVLGERCLVLARQRLALLQLLAVLLLVVHMAGRFIQLLLLLADVLDPVLERLLVMAVEERPPLLHDPGLLQ
jgi:hypothetical protein